MSIYWHLLQGNICASNPVSNVKDVRQPENNSIKNYKFVNIIMYVIVNKQLTVCLPRLWEGPHKEKKREQMYSIATKLQQQCVNVNVLCSL
jgi:hypothetical protein